MEFISCWEETAELYEIYISTSVHGKRECIALYALPLLGLLRSVSTVFGINTEFSKIVIAVVLDHF